VFQRAEGGGPQDTELRLVRWDGSMSVVERYRKPPGRTLAVSPDGRICLTQLVVPAMSDLLLIEKFK
jgi:hypothetical protein